MKNRLVYIKSKNQHLVPFFIRCEVLSNLNYFLIIITTVFFLLLPSVAMAVIFTFFPLPTSPCFIFCKRIRYKFIRLCLWDMRYFRLRKNNLSFVLFSLSISLLLSSFTTPLMRMVLRSLEVKTVFTMVINSLYIFSKHYNHFF